MRLGKYLSSLTKPELEEIKGKLNFTEDEIEILNMLSKRKTLTEISSKLQMSIPSVSRRIACIQEKMKGCECDMVKISISEKLNLTVEEAAEYSNIGINKLYELTNEPSCPFVLWVGKKRVIKRKEFEKFIDKAIEI